MTQTITTSDTSSCTCNACIMCCTYYPGWMTPEESQRAIVAGRGRDLMLDYFLPEIRYGNEDTIFVLCPASVGYEGQEAPFDPTWKSCTLLVNNRCSIHDTDFKPKQCRTIFACKQQGPDKIDMVKDWDTELGRSVVDQ